MSSTSLLVGILLAVSDHQVSALYMHGLFTDHAVLQMARPDSGTPQARLYGTADVAETVHVSGTNGFPTLSAKPTGAETGEGNWTVTVEPPGGKQGIDKLCASGMHVAGVKPSLYECA